MFSGIVEARSPVVQANKGLGSVRLVVEKPQTFNDLSVGDSICSDGVCLTVESFDDHVMTFALGAETLKITGWTAVSLQGRVLNLERSLRLGDRIHGHLVSGHVDGFGVVAAIGDLGGSVQLDVRAPAAILRYVWKKGSWTVNGVSLTVNSVVDSAGEGLDAGGIVGHCLIPETLRRTNLEMLKVGDRVNLEVDMMARGLVHYLETHGLEGGPTWNSHSGIRSGIRDDLHAATREPVHPGIHEGIHPEVRVDVHAGIGWERRVRNESAKE